MAERRACGCARKVPNSRQGDIFGFKVRTIKSIGQRIFRITQGPNHSPRSVKNMDALRDHADDINYSESPKFGVQN